MPGEQSRFLEEIQLKSKLPTNELAEIAGTCTRNFSDWKKEKLTMPLRTAHTLCSEFGATLPEDEEKMIKRWQIHQSKANRKGGIACFKIHGSPCTPDGRRKGGIVSIANLRRNGIIPKVKFYRLPTVFSENLAEFVGILLGDGGISQGQITITLNSEKDYAYAQYVSILGEKLFGEKPKMFKRKDEKTLVLYYNGSVLVQYFLSIGLKIGSKVRQQVGVPQWIVSSKKYSKVCLRGLMDTDGGVFLHKYCVRGKIYSYRKIAFTNRSIPLLYFAKKTLEELGFTPKIIDKVENKKVWLYNMQEVDKYLYLVGTRNPRLLRLYGG